MKNILVIYYTQSGQLKEIADNVIKTVGVNNEVNYLKIQPKHKYPFPWDKASFFDVFPETFAEKTIELEPIEEKYFQKKYDLIIFAYQIWFLSPSLPMSSFLKTNDAKLLLKDTPVISLIGCRNMWIMAHERVRKAFKDLGAKYVGNIVLRDRHGNLISVVTIVHWMFTGKKTKKYGIFPLPGVSDQDIKNASVFGEIINKALDNEDIDSVHFKLLEQKAVEVKPFLLTVEQKATKMFKIWSDLILSKSQSRKLLLKLFNFYLLFVIWIVSPLVFLIYLLTYFLKVKNLKKEIKYYQNI